MKKISDYNNFVNTRGRSLAEINPGSGEFALTTDEALQAIELLKNTQLPVVGGDVLTIHSGQLVYAYQLWGSQYIYLNWYCKKLVNENEAEYSIRSYEVAKEAINRADETSRELGHDCLIVLVVKK